MGSGTHPSRPISLADVQTKFSDKITSRTVKVGTLFVEIDNRNNGVISTGNEDFKGFRATPSCLTGVHGSG